MYRARSLQVRRTFKATNVLLLWHSGSSLFWGKKRSRSAPQLHHQQAPTSVPRSSLCREAPTGAGQLTQGAELLLGPRSPVTGHPSGRMGLARIFREEEPKRNSAKSGRRKGDSVFFFLHKRTDFSVLVRTTQSYGGGRKQPGCPGTRQQRSHNQSGAGL